MRCQWWSLRWIGLPGLRPEAEIGSRHSYIRIGLEIGDCCRNLSRHPMGWSNNLAVHSQDRRQRRGPHYYRAVLRSGHTTSNTERALGRKPPLFGRLTVPGLHSDLARPLTPPRPVPKFPKLPRPPRLPRSPKPPKPPKPPSPGVRPLLNPKPEPS